MRRNWHPVLTPLCLLSLAVGLLFGAAIRLAPALLTPLAVLLGLLVVAIGCALVLNLKSAAEFSAEQAARTRRRWPWLAPAYTTSVLYPRLGGLLLVLGGTVFTYQAAFNPQF